MFLITELTTTGAEKIHVCGNNPDIAAAIALGIRLNGNRAVMTVIDVDAPQSAKYDVEAVYAEYRRRNPKQKVNTKYVNFVCYTDGGEE